MSDPVSWLMIEPGWKVICADGSEIGRVEEVAGDSSVDIFNGLSVSHGAFRAPRYVPAEHVAEIVEGEVHLDLSAEEVQRLGDFEELPTTAEIIPEKASLAEPMEEPIVAPIHKRPERVNVFRRFFLWLKSRLGR